MPLHPSRSGATNAQLHVDHVSFDHPERRILDAVSFTVADGDRIGLTGPNGAGKSTLLALASGELEPAAGTVRLTPAEATVGLLRQELVVRPEETARSKVERSLGITAAATELAIATEEIAALADGADDRYDRAFRRWSSLGGATIDQRIEAGLERVGLDPATLEQPAETLSGGQRSKLGLAAIVLAEFDIVLLDEPTNDLDADGLDVLETVLGERDVPFVVVSHDRRFLERTVNAVLEIDPHSGRVARYEGGWQSFLDERDIARQHAQRRFDDFDQKRSQLEERARTERAWATKGANRAARQPRDNDKSIRNYAIETSENLAARARRTQKAIERLDEVEKPWVPWELQFRFGEAARSGDLVFQLTDAVVERDAAPARGTSFRLGPLSLEIRAGERVRIAGPNGVGKSTLLAVLLGDVRLATGDRRVGSSVTIGRIDQERDLTDHGSTVLAAVEHVTGLRIEECRSTLAKFGLSAADVERSVADVSPGERTRALLATFQLRGVNTVILDEPTNHLDLEALEQLETALETYEGTLLVVSHDRAFLDALHLTRTITLP